ncbi:hypothetical protein HOF78_01275 [Candidatus Woesearchaeota archaeon]|jgi:hypothetical protein|nr:hypothetical protein [Candidatus Woesearchaeota archaeon]MBT6044985.1 hypothetical protein [Candidatus Woesearchaeota archaeon]
MNLRNLAKRSLAPLVLACSIAPSCSDEPSIPQLSPEQIIAQIEGTYNVDVVGNFSPKVLGALKNTLEKTESIYPGLLPQLNMRIRGVSNDTLQKIGCLGFTSPSDVEATHITARKAVSKLDEIQRRLEAGENIPREELMAALKPGDELMSGLKSGAYNVLTVNIPTTIPSESLAKKGETFEGVIGHEIGHAVFSNQQLYSGLEAEYNKITPSRRNSLISTYSSAGSDTFAKFSALEKLLGATLEIAKTKFYTNGILNEGFVSNHPRLADTLGATKDLLEIYISRSSGEDRSTFEGLAEGVNEHPYSTDGSFHSEDFATFFSYTVNPRDLKGDFPKVETKAKLMKSEIKEAYKLK